MHVHRISMWLIVKRVDLRYPTCHFQRTFSFYPLFSVSSISPIILSNAAKTYRAALTSQARHHQSRSSSVSSSRSSSTSSSTDSSKMSVPEWKSKLQNAISENMKKDKDSISVCLTIYITLYESLFLLVPDTYLYYLTVSHTIVSLIDSWT